MATLSVIRAEHAGACYGVQRALDMTLKASAESGSVCTLGPLIHNPRVVAELEEQGIHVAGLGINTNGTRIKWLGNAFLFLSRKGAGITSVLRFRKLYHIHGIILMHIFRHHRPLSICYQLSQDIDK